MPIDGVIPHHIIDVDGKHLEDWTAQGNTLLRRRSFSEARREGSHERAAGRPHCSGIAACTAAIRSWCTATRAMA